MPKNDGSESCTATLTIRGRQFDGSTGSNGHAEMNALDKFMKDGGQNAAQKWASLRRARDKTVACPSKDVCLKCRRVLEGLGFTKANGTTFGTKNMGSTEWGTSLKVRELLSAAGLDYEKILALKDGQTDKSISKA